MRLFISGASSRRVIALFLMLTISVLMPLDAEERAEEAATAEEATASDDAEADVVVTATRIKDDRLRVPPFVVVLQGSDLAALGEDGIGEAAAACAGVALYDQGASGSLETIWLRGASPIGVLILLDGIPANNAVDGQMDLSLIPPDIIDRIEIIQGGMSVLYGSHAIGGVVNIITKKGKSLDSFLSGSLSGVSYLPQAYTEAGAALPPQANALFDGGRTALSLGHNFGPFSLVFSGSFDWRRNEYYYSDGGTVGRRENADLLGGQAFTGLSFPWETGELSVTGLYARHKIGTPYTLSFPTPLAVETDERLQVGAAFHESRFFSELLALDAKVSLTQQYRLNEDPAFASREETNITAFFAEISQRASAADFLALVYGGNIAYDYVKGTVYAGRDRVSGSVFLSLPVTAGEILHLYPTGRLDLYSDFGAEFSYGLGVSLSVSQAVSLKIAFSKSFRAPNFLELYYPGFSNPSLKPERGWHGDLGLSLKTDRVKLESALFARLMQDEIKLDAFWIPQNIAQSFYPGAELQAEIEFLDGFFIEAAYTLIYSFNLANGRTLAEDTRMPYVPLHELHVYLAHKTEATVIRAGADVKSGRFNNNYSRELPPQLILNANLRRNILPAFTLVLALDNILNLSYQTIDGYPMPGISLRWGLEFKL